MTPSSVNTSLSNMAVPLSLAGTDTSTCTEVAVPLAHATIVKNLTREAGGIYGLYYQCEEGWGMVSGQPGTLAQCSGGAWTPLHDVCVQGMQKI